MSVEFKLPKLDEAVQRLDSLMTQAFAADHGAMQDWVAVRFALKERGKLAEIDSLPGKGWGARAAAGDALARVENDAPFIAAWITKDADGDPLVKWSKANLTFENACALAAVFAEFVNGWVRDAMNRKGRT